MQPFLTCLVTAALLVLSLNCGASMAEFADCARVPEEILFRREGQDGSSAYVVRRYERYKQEGWTRWDYKNPERSLLNGPLHARNCGFAPFGQLWVAPPGGTQRLSFKFKTVNYFGSGIANHLAILLRASFDRTEGVTGGSQSGRGLAIFPTATFAEDFSLGLGPGATFALEDSIWYAVDVIATRSALTFLLTGPNGLIADVTWPVSAAQDAAGYGFAVLCAYAENASCEFPDGSSFARLPFEVQFSDIAVRWSVEEDEARLPRHEKRRPRSPRLGATTR